MGHTLSHTSTLFLLFKEAGGGGPGKGGGFPQVSWWERPGVDRLCLLPGPSVTPSAAMGERERVSGLRTAAGVLGGRGVWVFPLCQCSLVAPGGAAVCDLGWPPHYTTLYYTILNCTSEG